MNINIIKINKLYNIFMLRLTIFILSWAIVHFQNVNYKKIIHNINPEAKCLDGSPGLLYVHEGSDINNFLIFFEGGGLCGQQNLAKTLESCYQRSKTLLGSSKYWPQQLNQDTAQGYLSTNPNINPYANWTKFIFGYCDGALHQGFSKEPIKYKDALLYFRGAAITRSHFEWIISSYPQIKTATRIILTGGSAGGIAVHLWNNYFRQIIPNPNSVYSIDDSGVFLNFKTHLGDNKIQKMIQNIYKISNTQEPTPFTECNTINKGEQWKCLFLQYGYMALKGKYMILNSEYDSWTIPNLLQIKCITKGQFWYTLTSCTKNQLTYIQKYRNQYKNLITKFVGVHYQSSVWTISCVNHVYACINLFFNNQLQKVPQIVGKTVIQSIKLFVNNEKIINFDVVQWPNNKLCSK